MKELTLEEVREKKLEAEAKIGKIIIDFISETGANVTEINGDLEILHYASESKTDTVVHSISLEVQL